MNEPLKEWDISVPWGKIALVSWGDPDKAPMLLVHGRNDSADTFRPLVELLPPRYHFVALDLPGNGNSDPLPNGVQLQRLHFLRAVELVVEHLGWTSFVFLGHSLGGELGMFYASLHPNRITRMILIDTIVVALASMESETWDKHYAQYHHDYYSNYSKYNTDKRTYSKQRAIEVVMKARGLTTDQAALVLRRNLIQVGDDVYKLKWDKRLRALAPTNMAKEEYFQILTNNAPPTLYLISQFSIKRFATKDVLATIEDMKMKSRSQVFEVMKGNHDLHLTSTERVAKCAIEFLNRDYGETKAKL